ncbi:hypothetical protein SAMN05421823_109237 [Catalinimonas alkaloidigena]|uniref:Uncharacterized protein n=1 Tax=Catalinimonas alkaloidigena TaxID=1075417 RepID=A0A1G9PMB4_9BACT|nr:hypothetical protein [Catalinimonas alkaloidigena]SDL99844.1 hypothetical protein SAMN05421823_109237 [Catalinimonas alkaloidigena]
MRALFLSVLLLLWVIPAAWAQPADYRHQRPYVALVKLTNRQKVDGLLLSADRGGLLLIPTQSRRIHFSATHPQRFKIDVDDIQKLRVQRRGYGRLTVLLTSLVGMGVGGYLAYQQQGLTWPGDNEAISANDRLVYGGMAGALVGGMTGSLLITIGRKPAFRINGDRRFYRQEVRPQLIPYSFREGLH